MGPDIGTARLYGRRFNQTTYNAAAQTFNTAYDKVGIGANYAGRGIGKASKYIEKASIHTQGYYDAYASEKVNKAAAGAATAGNNFMNNEVSSLKTGIKNASSLMGARSSLYNETAWERTKAIDASNRTMINKGLSGPAAPGGTSAGKFFAKAGMAATIGSGVKREAFMNSLGLLTRHQKAAAKSGGMAGAQRWMMPLGAAVGGAMTLAEGGGVVDYAADFVLPSMGIMAGWSVGKNLGFGAAKSFGALAGGISALSKATGGKGSVIGGVAARRGMSLGMGAVGGVAGAAVGLAATVAIGEVAKQFGDSNSEVNQTAESLRYAKFNSDFDMTQNQLTHRQRTLSKLSKSGLNDRGTLLGNEAQVMAGII